MPEMLLSPTACVRWRIFIEKNCFFAVASFEQLIGIHSARGNELLQTQ